MLKYLLITLISFNLFADENQDWLTNQLNFWKDLLDRDLINQSDYDKVKNNLISEFNNLGDKNKNATSTDISKESKDNNQSKTEFEINLNYKIILDYENVGLAQYLLNKTLDINLVIDCKIGPNTKEALYKWHSQKKDKPINFTLKDLDDLKNDFMKKNSQFDYHNGYCKNNQSQEVISAKNTVNKEVIDQKNLNIEKSLFNLGYLSYADGIIDSETYDAIRQWQFDNNFGRGPLTDQQYNALVKGSPDQKLFKKDEYKDFNKSSKSSTISNELVKSNDTNFKTVDMSYKKKNYINNSLINQKKWTKIKDYCESSYRPFWEFHECVSVNTKKYKMYYKAKDLYDVYIAYGEMLALQVLGGEINDAQAKYYLLNKQNELNDSYISKNKSKFKDLLDLYNNINSVVYGNNSNYNFNNNYNSIKNSSFGNGRKICNIDRLSNSGYTSYDTYQINCR